MKKIYEVSNLVFCYFLFRPLVVLKRTEEKTLLMGSVLWAFRAPADPRLSSLNHVSLLLSILPHGPLLPSYIPSLVKVLSLHLMWWRFPACGCRCGGVCAYSACTWGGGGWTDEPLFCVGVSVGEKLKRVRKMNRCFAREILARLSLRQALSHQRTSGPHVCSHCFIS